MTEAEGAVGLDRLPWLADDPVVHKGRHRVLPLAFVAILLMGAAAYSLGLAAFHFATPSFGPSPVATATVPLPEPLPVVQPPPPPPALNPLNMEPVEPVVSPPVVIVEPTPVRSRPVQRLSVKRVAAAVTDSASEPKLVDNSSETGKTPAIPQLWPVRVVEGASGRLIRIGTFASTHDAKKGWSAITHLNPAMEHLPALVVPVRSLRDGEVYYRLQMGTTSQAHSTVLCQRMRMIAQSCVVIGLGGDGGEIAI